MSPCAIATITSARGLKSWAGSSAAATAAKGAFGVCEGAAADGEERGNGHLLALC